MLDVTGEWLGKKGGFMGKGAGAWARVGNGMEGGMGWRRVRGKRGEWKGKGSEEGMDGEGGLP